MQTNNFSKLKFVYKNPFAVFNCFMLIVLFLGLSAYFTSCNSIKNKEWNEDFIEDESYSDFIKQADDYLNNKKFSGSVLVGKDSDIIFAKGYGLSDGKDSSSPKNTIHSVYEIGSLTKQMTAAAIMQLVQAGKLSIDDKISKFFPDYVHGDEITVEMLLTMHSGLFDHINMPYDYFPSDIASKLDKAAINCENDSVGRDVVLDYLYDSPLMITPGSTHFYCNTDYYLLGKIIEILSGMDYEDYIQQNILDKCGMWESNLRYQDTTTKGYDYRGRYISILGGLGLGCGDVNSSVIDLFKWIYSLTNGKVVSKKSFEKMITPNPSGYGYGVYHDDSSFLHGGATNAFNSFCQYFFEDEISIIVLANEPIGECSATIVAGNLKKMLFESKNA